MDVFIESQQFFENILVGMINYKWCDICKSQLEISGKQLAP